MRAARETKSKVLAAVVNGTGYGGVELVRLLHHHPGFELIEVTARSEAGKPVSEVFPNLPNVSLAFSEHVEHAEVVFVALPDHAAADLVPALLSAGRRVIDLSAAFRLQDPTLYPKWYSYEHGTPALLEQAIYGLAEFARELLPSAKLVACPGCYPTAALLALVPASAHCLIEPDVIIDAKSGVSGAGRTLKLNTHFSEANEDISAYGLEGHRHWPEIQQGLTRFSTRSLRLTFTPHLVPMTRGILATCYATLQSNVTPADVSTVYASMYANEPFVHITSHPPHTKWTLGSNACFIYPIVDQQSHRLIVVSAIDNLIKGAAGQAIQCANLMYGLPETTGLPVAGVYP